MERKFPVKNRNLSNAIEGLMLDCRTKSNINRTLPENFDWFIKLNRTPIEHNIERQTSIELNQNLPCFSCSIDVRLRSTI